MMSWIRFLARDEITEGAVCSVLRQYQYRIRILLFKNNTISSKLLFNANYVYLINDNAKTLFPNYISHNRTRAHLCRIWHFVQFRLYHFHTIMLNENYIQRLFSPQKHFSLKFRTSNVFFIPLSAIKAEEKKTC